MPGNLNYECTAEVSTDGNAKIYRYKSKNSGITICIAEINGPVVNGYLCLATEAHDDDGLPHTLEHLVFMGSEDYPYKGVLDLIANRCLAQGTNAWTDTDHTCYTMSTAESEGFLKLLPIYVDHLLYPTLTDSAFITEVHHINGEGEDAGVVYCEMQACENNGENKCHLAMLRAMYPGECGYKSETGGLMKNLRESTTNEKVCTYHRKFYRPENLCVIIVGQVDVEKVFEALEPIEEKISKDVDRENFVRPWQSPVPPLQESVTLGIDYPCDEDEYGLVYVAWRGPLISEFRQIISMKILMEYLTDTSVAPLNREFVEIEDPFCNEVDYSVIENSVLCIYLHFSDVPVNKICEIKDKLFSVLGQIANGSEELDMNRMKTLIKKRKLYILNSMEHSPHDRLAGCLIQDFLYGNTSEDLSNAVQEIPVIETLFTAEPDFWIDLIKLYLIEANSVTVLGNPSPAVSEQMSEEEKQRVQQQKHELGEDGLKEKAETLKKAMEVNEIPAPKETTTSITVPSVDSINYHPIQRNCNALESGEGIDYNIKEMPCRFELDVMKTSFVRLFILMDTSDLPLNLRMYLPLFIELLDECPIEKDGEIIPYQEVVKQLAADTISVHASLGLGYSRFFCSAYAQAILLQLTVEEEKYEKSVHWVREMLYQVIFEPSRIKSAVNKMLSSVAKTKRSGSSIVKTIMKNLCFSMDSNHWSASMLRQYTFLSGVLEKLDGNSDEVVASLNEVRHLVTKPDKMVVHLALNLEHVKKISEPERAWTDEFLPPEVSPGMLTIPFKMCYEFIKTDGPEFEGMIFGNGSVESSYLRQTVPSLNSCTHPDYAPLLALISYLTQAEGPMWHRIRGLGLSYSYSISLSHEVGLLSFVLFKSSHLVKAYKEALDIVESYLSGESKWEEDLLESGSSSLVFDLIDNVKTVDDVVSESLKAYCNGVDMDFTKNLVKKISLVTVSDLQRVCEIYLKPLFNPKSSWCAVCCHPDKVLEIVDGFGKFSRELTVVPSLDESFMTKF